MEELIKHERVKGTPFTIVETEEGCFVAIGQNRMTEITTKEEVNRMLKEKDWTLILNAIFVIANNLKSKENDN